MRIEPSDVDRVRRIYDRIARRYDPMMAVVDALLFSGGRSWVATTAEGCVLEVAIGTGRNLALYSRATRIVGVDVSLAMLALAQQRSESLPLHVDLHVGDAQRLDLPNASFDTVVFTLALCSIPDPKRAVNEAWRVLRPGGRLLALEHVRSPVAPVRAAQRALQPLFVRAMCDNLLREPADEAVAAGFEIERIERARLGIVERLVAIKPT